MTTQVLPIVDIFKEALALPIRNFKVLLKLAIPPLAISILIITLSFNIEGDNVDGAQIGFLLLGVLAGATALAAAVVGAHRTYLLSDEEYREKKLFYWSGNEFKYVGWWMLIGLLTSLLAIPIAFGIFQLNVNIDKDPSTFSVYSAVFLLINIPLYYLASRWAMVLPASATDNHGKTLTWSWEMTKENGWRITVLLGLFPFLMEILFSLLPNYDSIFYTIFLMVSWGGVFCIELALLSLCYAFFNKQEVAKD